MSPRTVMTKSLQISDSLFQDLRSLIIEARQDVARQVNSALVLLYWRVGLRIRKDILKEKRADYGEQIVATLSQQLTEEFGEGFAEKNLRRMVQFAEVFPDEQIVVTLSRQLGWSHFVAIIPLDDNLKRDFYAEMCRIERWSVRTLRQKISGMLFLIQGTLCALRYALYDDVAAYLTELPPRRLLQKKLHEAILLARARLEEKSAEPGNA
jgi:hypothetical protein